MQHAEVLAAIRRLVQSMFRELGAEPSVKLREHILLRDGTYCGRRFEAGGCQAIWFIEEDEIKVYGPDGAVARVMSASKAVQPEYPPHPQAA